MSHQPQRASVRFRQKPRASSAQRLILRKDYVELNFQFLTLRWYRAGCGLIFEKTWAHDKPGSATGNQQQAQQAAGSALRFLISQHIRVRLQPLGLLFL